MDFFLEFQSVEWNQVTTDCKSSKISGLAFANIQGKHELIMHHFDKNIMKKTVSFLVFWWFYCVIGDFNLNNIVL